jgi:4'-phosphopantetheinyl transferase
MSQDLRFTAAAPTTVAATLDARAIHVWRIPYALSQRRAPLRAMLGAYLGIPADAVALDEDAHGKPRLATAPSRASGTPALDFNWSHSGDYALIGLSRGGALGVDIERFGKDRRALEIARRFFDPAEADALATLDARARDDAFIGLWCAKEAVLKAAGEGLSFGLERLAFARDGAINWQLTEIDAALGTLDDWQLTGFVPAPGYHGTLAWRGPPRAIHAFLPAGEQTS